MAVPLSASVLACVVVASFIVFVADFPSILVDTPSTLPYLQLAYLFVVASFPFSPLILHYSKSGEVL